MKIVTSMLIVFSALVVVYPAAAADVAVDQVGQKFDPHSVTIKVGDSIKFLNNDDVDHNITLIDSGGVAEDRGIQKPGTIIPVRFSAAGEFLVRCSMHPRMKMQVKVE